MATYASYATDPTIWEANNDLTNPRYHFGETRCADTSTPWLSNSYNGRSSWNHGDGEYYYDCYEEDYSRESFQATAKKKTDDWLMDRQTALDKAMEMLMDPVTNSPAKGKQVDGIITLHVDDVFIVGTDAFVKEVTEKLAKDFKVGTQDRNDVMFVGQRVRWIMENGKKKRIQVDQIKKVEELSEIQFDKSLRDEIYCTPDLHKQYRSVLGQILVQVLARYRLQCPEVSSVRVDRQLCASVLLHIHR